MKTFLELKFKPLADDEKQTYDEKEEESHASINYYFLW